MPISYDAINVEMLQRLQPRHPALFLYLSSEKPGQTHRSRYFYASNKRISLTSFSSVSEYPLPHPAIQ